MNLELLKNQEEFEAWKEGNIFSGDTAEQPSEFPCYARTVVQSRPREEECAVYLYRKDVEKMLADMTPTAGLERIVVGKCTITHLDDGDYWIRHASGEGMQTPKAKFERLIDEYYKSEF